MVHVRDSLIRSTCKVTNDRFEAFVVSMERAYGVFLARPRFESVGDIKKFCEGLIEGQKNHPWREDLRRHRCSDTVRLSIAHSLFLFRKVIPNSEPQCKDYVERMSQPQAEADPWFVDECRKLTRRLFPIGWDRAYLRHAELSTLPVTSCYETNRKGGGARGLDELERMNRTEFCEYVMNSVAPRPRGVSKVCAVLTGGKWRVVSVPSRIDNALRPFHKTLYDHVSKFEWCLRGDAKPKSFKGFTRNGETFVSGDYESATDNLNSEVQLAILTELILRSRSIPRGILLHALSTFNSKLECDGEIYVQRRGQLMGQLLSFPLLCLINYITFKISVPRNVPVRINGDDIVFRASTEEISRWEENVSKSGLVLSVGKTMKSRKFFSLNSSIFQSQQGIPRVVPYVRSKALWGDKENDCEKIASLKNRFYSFCVGMGQRRGEHFRRLFLTENASTIRSCRRSLTRGMGIKVSEETLKATALWKRELFYLREPEERPLPSFSFSQVKCNDLPAGWKKQSLYSTQFEGYTGFAQRRFDDDYVKYQSACFVAEMVENAWTKPVITNSEARKKWMSACDLGTKEWSLRGLVTRKIMSMMKLSRRLMWRYLLDVEVGSDPRRNWGKQRFSRKSEGVWLPCTDVPCDKANECRDRSSPAFSDVGSVSSNRYSMVAPPNAYDIGIGDDGFFHYM